MITITEGLHRPDKYMRYSQTTSGGTIYHNPHAPPHERWFIEHTSFGNRYFANHDDILRWTVEETRERYKRATGG